MLHTILVVTLVFALLPTVLRAWGYSASWGYGPSVGIGMILLIATALLFIGRI